MSISAATLKRLAALQLAPEAMQEVLSIIASCIEPLDERRRRDRDRKRGGKFRGRVDGNSAETVTEESPPAYTTPPAKKPKRVSLHTATSEIPENPSEEAKGFAEKQGWEASRVNLEWQRFRDHSLSKGKKHRDMLAAWRNWVRSPYQSNGAPNGRYPASAADKSASAAAGRLLEKIRSFDLPLDQDGC